MAQLQGALKMKVAHLCLTVCDPMELYSPWNSPGQNTGVGSCSLLQGIFPDPGIEPASLMSPAVAGRFFTTSATWLENYK